MSAAKATAPDTATLRVTDMAKRFRGVVAVDGVSLTVRPASVHGLIGPNGAGKSTLIGLVSGFLRADAGTVELGDRELTGRDPATVAAAGLTRTFQSATPLAGLTVLENVLVGMHGRFRSGSAGVVLRLPGMRREERTHHAAAVELLEEYGLAAVADTPATDLSFGQLRLLEVARAVAGRPRFLLLDEPAAGLNGVETERLADVISRLRDSGVGVLLVDHDVPFVFGVCDEVSVMDLGALIAAGPPDEVRDDAVVRAAYLGTGEPAGGER